MSKIIVMTETLTFIWFFLGCLSTLSLVLIVSGLRNLIRFREHTAQKERLKAALNVIHSHGLKAQRYLPGWGEPNMELREALEAFQHTDQVITNKNGLVVGKLSPPKFEAVIKKSPTLRLVISK